MATPDDYEAFSSNQLKHLEMTQAVVGRLAANGFLIKGWAVTVTAAVAGIGVAQADGWLALVGVVPVVAFWYLDATFLRSERAFRVHCDRILRGEVAAFEMNAVDRSTIRQLAEDDRGRVSWTAVLRRPSLIGFYGAMLALLLLVAALAGSLDEGEKNDPGLPRQSLAEIRSEGWEPADV